MKRRANNVLTILLILSVLLLLVACVGATRTSASAGTLEVQISDHREAIGDFERLDITVEQIAIHPAGMARTEGWLAFEPDTAIVDLTRVVDGPPKTVLYTAVASGLYDAVRLSVLDSEGALKNGGTTVVAGFEEAVRLEFALPENGKITLLLDVIVESTEDHPGGSYEMHLRTVTVQ